MKKLLSVLIVLAMALTLLASCGLGDNTPEVTECAHEFKDATCITPKTCTKCQKTEGDVIAHTVESGKCPTCGASLFDVMKLWDEEPGKSGSSTPTYDYYGKTDYHDMYENDVTETDGFVFWGGKSIDFGQKKNNVSEYSAAGQLIITKDGIENKTYKWNLIVTKYVDNAFKRMVMTGTLDASEFSEDSTLVMSSFSDPFKLGLTQEQAEEYVELYATELVWGAVTGNMATFLTENGENPTVLGFANYKK